MNVLPDLANRASALVRWYRSNDGLGFLSSGWLMSVLRAGCRDGPGVAHLGGRQADESLDDDKVGSSGDQVGGRASSGSDSTGQHQPPVRWRFGSGFLAEPSPAPPREGLPVTWAATNGD